MSDFQLAKKLQAEENALYQQFEQNEEQNSDSEDVEDQNTQIQDNPELVQQNLTLSEGSDEDLKHISDIDMIRKMKHKKYKSRPPFLKELFSKTIRSCTQLSWIYTAITLIANLLMIIILITVIFQ